MFPSIFVWSPVLESNSDGVVRTTLLNIIASPDKVIHALLSVYNPNLHRQL